MATVDDIRKAYPAFAHLDDDGVVDALQKTYYRDQPREAVAARLGVKTVEPTPPATFGDRVGDAMLSLEKGAIAVPETAVGVADLATGGRVGKFLANDGGAIGFRPAEAKAFLDSGYSPAQKAAFQRVNDARGFIDTAQAALENPSTVLQSAIESAPSMGAGGAVSRGALALLPRMGGIVSGALGEGIVQSGQAAESIRQDTADGLITPTQAGLAVASGVGDTALALLGGKVAHSLGLHDAQTMMAVGHGDPAARQGIVKSLLGGALSEGVLEELPQSIQEQVAQNAAMGKPLDEGVDQAAVMGLFTGAAMGGGANALGAAGKIDVPTPAPIVIGPTSRAANVAVATGAADNGGAPAHPVPDLPHPHDEAATQLLDEAQQRAEALKTAERGTPEVKNAKGKVTQEEILPRTLTPAEKLEQTFIDEHGGDPTALAHGFGVTPETRPDAFRPTDVAQAAHSELPTIPQTVGGVTLPGAAPAIASSAVPLAPGEIPTVHAPDGSQRAVFPDLLTAQAALKAARANQGVKSTPVAPHPLPDGRFVLAMPGEFGRPYPSRTAATAAAARAPGAQAVKVDGGWMVQPAPKAETDDERIARIKATPGAQRTDADIQWANDRSRAAAKIAQDAQAAIEAKAAAERTDTNGFAETATSPLQQGKIRAALSQQVQNGGRAISRRDLVREKVAAGATIGTREGQRALVSTNGTHLTEKQLGKTALDYAQHLTNAPVTPEVPEAAPPGGAGTPATERPAGARTAPVEAARLPQALTGAKPRYAFGSKQFTLKFASDVDRAAYIAAQAKPSKQDAKFVEWATATTGMSEKEVRAHGAQVRAAIKEQARAAEKGGVELSVPEFRAQQAAPAAPNVVPHAEAQRVVSAFTAGWKGAPTIHVVATTADIPGHDASKQSRGVINLSSGDTYIVADQAKSHEDIANTLVHEVLGHFGLRAAFGGKLVPILDQLAVARADLVAAKAKHYGLDMKDLAQRREAADEVLAELAETQPTQGWVRRAVSTVRNWLRAAGLKLNLSDNDIAGWLASARRAVERNAPDANLRNLDVGRNAERRSNMAEQRVEGAFSRWFGKSRVVNGDGNPQVMYHGTSRDFNIFDRDFTKTFRKPSIDTIGSWFSSDPSRAGVYAGGEGHNVMAVYLSIQKPKVYKTFAALLDDMHKAAGRDPKTQVPRGIGSTEELRTKLQSQGYDGIRIEQSDVQSLHDEMAQLQEDRRKERDPEYRAEIDKEIAKLRKVFDKYGESTEFDGHDVWIAFEPTQIKSAIGNNGQFDPTNLDIRFQLADLVQAPLNAARSMTLPGGYLVGDFMRAGPAPGKLNWWHKTIGSEFNLAERNPLFRPVYNAVQRFIRDISFHANEAADLAPSIIRTLDGWRDIFKTPLSVADQRALNPAVFGGIDQTDGWTRDAAGNAVQVSEHQRALDTAHGAATAAAARDNAARAKQYANATVAQKRSMLLAQKHITPDVMTMWDGMQADAYEKMIHNSFAKNVVNASVAPETADEAKPGILFTDDELKRLFNMTPAQIGMYHEVRSAVDHSLDQLAVTHMLNAADTRLNPAQREKVLATLSDDPKARVARKAAAAIVEISPEMKPTVDAMADTTENLQDNGYMPASRFGEWVVDIHDGSGKRTHFFMFENEKDRARFVRELNASGEFADSKISQGTIAQSEYQQFGQMSPDTLQLFAELLERQIPGISAKDKVFEEFVHAARASTSTMQRLTKREGISGFKEDVGRVLAGFIASNARLASHNMNNADIDRSIAGIPQGEGQLKDHAIALASYVRQPKPEATKLRGLLFAEYLGGSIASAMVNMSQSFATTLPFLTQYQNPAAVGKTMFGASRQISRLVKQGTTGDKALDAALKRADEEGTTAPQEMHQLRGLAEGKASLHAGDGTRTGDAVALAHNAFTRTAMIWSKVFGVAEQFNRRLAFISAYNIARERGEVDPFAFATRVVDSTQFVSNKGNKPTWARGPIGGTLFTFKSYSISYLEMLSRLATSGPQGRKAALYAVAALMMMAGADGLPFVEDIDDLVDGFMQRVLGYNFSSKGKRHEFLQGVLGDELGRFMTKGFTGIPGMPMDVSGRLGMANLIPGTGLLVDKADHTGDVTELAGPVGDLIKRGFQASGQLADGQVGAAALSIAPKAVQSAVQGAKMLSSGQYNDQQGKKVIETTPGDAMSKMLGFQPWDVANVQGANFEAQKAKAEYQLKLSQLTDKLAQAMHDGDAGDVAAVRAEIDRYNEKNPELPIRVKASALRSRLLNMNLTKEQRIERSSPAGIRATIRERIAEGQ